MTRPRVEPEKRQRTAQACDSCKRRKQKCNGASPCNTCTKRTLSCTYGTSESEIGFDDEQSPSKRQVMDPSLGNCTSSPVAQGSPRPIHRQPTTNWASLHTDLSLKARNMDMSCVQGPRNPAILLREAQKNNLPLHAIQATSQTSPESMSKSSTVDDPDEEAVVYNSTRMLQDPTGRLLYIGDAASLSFLQLIRMFVDSVVGPTPFTRDPRRHSIVENGVSLPPNIRHTHLLPDKQTAIVLVESYFTNTNGLIELFCRGSFMATLDACFADPLGVDPSWLCLLYLTFAIGLVMASPVPGSREHAIIEKLRAESADRAEIFYSDAKRLSDPSTGFEDAGFWSIQALALMSLYMLAVSKRNAAYAYYGMAVRSAFALGLHREETMCISSNTEQSVRRNLWRSLFVIDRFLSASLGRPTAIRESDCSGISLTAGEVPPFPQAPFPTAANAAFVNSQGLQASVRSSHVIGVILDKVYSKRRISTKIAQEIADHCKGWPKTLDPNLHWRQASSADPHLGIAILHVNLLYCHSIVLLTRPFFLFLMNKKHQEKVDHGQRTHNCGTKMDKFAEACVIASSHSVALVQNAFENRYLPHRNPFVLYFLFAAALVILSNEFSMLFQYPVASTSIENAINIMSYCAQHDPQANRLLFILTSFRDVVVSQRARACQQPFVSQQNQGSSRFPSVALGNEFGGDDLGVFVQETTGPSKASLKLSAPALNQQINNPTKSSPKAYLKSPTSLSPDLSAKVLNDKNEHLTSRRSSHDTFLYLARVSSNPNSGASNDENESQETEFDFESLWQFPTNSAPLTPGATPGIGFTSCYNADLLVSHET